MTKISITTAQYFNRKKLGIWGTLGSGGNCEVHFLQTILTADDIDNVKLISDIPESQTWPIQDLFQRNVNISRVNNGIIPYLNDQQKVKFFNPLTLIVLPHEDNLKIIKEVPLLSEEKFNEYGVDFDGKSKPLFYRFGISREPYLGILEWNTNKSFMVAIDGQHRLSALKEIKNDPDNTFKDWKVPAVILIIHRTEKVQADLLEIVRRLFVDINEKSERLSRARKIILNDTLPVDVLCQEIIQYSHQHSGNNILPLYFFDWRGDTDSTQIPVSKIVSIEELNDWFIAYFGFSPENSLKFKVPNWLLSLGLPNGELDYLSANKLRQSLKGEFVPSFHKFLSSLDFIKKYFDSIIKTFSKQDLKYFIEKEQYGTHKNTNYTLEKKYEDDFVKKISGSNGIREKVIPSYLKKDIGMRGIIFCFSEFNEFEKIYSVKYPNRAHLFDWNVHSEFCSMLINKILDEGWLSDKMNQKQRKILINLIVSSSDEIINYKLDSAGKSLGSLLMILCIKHSGVDIKSPEIDKLLAEYFELIEGAYKTDIRKEVKADLLTVFSGNQTQLKDKIDKETSKKISEKMKVLRSYLFNI